MKTFKHIREELDLSWAARMNEEQLNEAWFDVDSPTPLRDARNNYKHVKSMSPEQRHLHVRNVRAINALKGTAAGALLGTAVGGPLGGTVGAVAGGLSNYAYKRPNNY